MEMEKNSSLKQGWIELEIGMQQIYSTKISEEYYAELYKRVSTIFVNSSDPNIIAIWFCKKIENYLKNHLAENLENIKNLEEADLVSQYVQLWDDYCSSSLSLHAVFGYMNKNHCNPVENPDCIEVYTLALIQWKECILVRLQDSLSKAIINLVNLKEDANSSLISTTLNSYLEMGLDNRNDPDFSLYKAGFANKDFILEPKLLYITGRPSIFKNSVFVFLKKMDIWLEEQGLLDLEERRRAFEKLDMQPVPNQEFRDIFRKLMVNYSEEFFLEFRKALSDSKTDDLQMMYQFTVSGNLVDLEAEFENYVSRLGIYHMNSFKEKGKGSPEIFTGVVYTLHQRYNDIVNRAFGGQTVFVEALNRACKTFMNIDFEISGEHYTAAGLLAKYYDNLLKNESRLYTVVDGLNKSMIVYKFLDNKAEFRQLYADLMGQRLFQDTCCNFPREKVITKLLEKMGCGFPYMVNTLRIFREVQNSRILTKAFKTTLDNVMHFDFHFNIIKFSFWPVERTMQLQLPQELHDFAQEFNTFYNYYNEDKRLIWLHGMSSCELATSYFNKPYIFLASAPQVALLMQFNSSESLTLQQLQEATEIEPEIMLQLAQVLVDLRILTATEAQDLTMSSSLTLNSGYENEDLSVHIHVPINEDLKEKTTLYENVEEDQKHVLEATIVRVAKINKEINHLSLIEAVRAMLVERFVPEVPLIERCIEKLIEKEYLKRENDTYFYVV